MIDSEFRPDGEQFAERSTQEQSGVSPFDFLAGNQPNQEEGEYQESLQLVHPFDPFNQMRKFNSAYERKQWNEIGFQPTEEQNTMVRNVKIAYGIIAEPFCGEIIDGELSRTYYQDEIVHEIGTDQMVNGNNRVVLTDEERAILVKIAKSAGVPCNPKKIEYFYDEIPPADWLEKHKRYITPPKVVDADQ